MRISLPLQLLLVIIGVVLFGGFIPDDAVRVCYTFSVMFKEFLGMIIPYMVFFFVMAGILSFQRNAPLVLAILLTTIFFSNALVALISYGVFLLFLPLISCTADSMITAQHIIEPFFSFSIPTPVPAFQALVAAVIFGILCSIFRVPSWIMSTVSRAKYGIEVALKFGFIPLLPLYVLGFLLKMRHEGLITCLIQQYGSAVILIVSLQTVYLLWMFFLASGFSVSRALSLIKNCIPPYITAFSTMSSTATVPVSIEAAEHNTGTRGLPALSMPIMANVHLLGDSIGTPILAMTTMIIFQGIVPPVMQYLGFVFYFCITMFAASGIPGGGIIVMIPVLISQLDFSPSMVSVITMLYFMLDPFGTAANVTGDGALVVIVQKLLRRLKIVV